MLNMVYIYIPYICFCSKCISVYSQSYIKQIDKMLNSKT